jgi:hypothetical protein
VFLNVYCYDFKFVYRIALNFAAILNKLKIGMQINKQSNTMISVGSIEAKSAIVDSVA